MQQNVAWCKLWPVGLAHIFTPPVLATSGNVTHNTQDRKSNWPMICSVCAAAAAAATSLTQPTYYLVLVEQHHGWFMGTSPPPPLPPPTTTTTLTSLLTLYIQ
ncbi:hypothetical protein F5B22DRAFT_555853 [Xylaria bambusicola]|uniref:uncharacterized protein n=1 Tax=Xylaria bambusicola TaxID=326684 RepID=UPI0020072F44|nr:uncharacterized protein F5B22DRAFT_555853 [Xylaria bambusicola]KAI0503279.1 hypothetical protein F5B22DRAFT_555853 [Xylaria bambusicola]